MEKFFHFKKNIENIVAENIEKIGVHQQEYIWFLKSDFPQVSITFSTSRKNSE